MDEEEIKIDIENVRSLIKEHKRRLHLLEMKYARQGAQADPDLEIEIEDKKSVIRVCEQKYDILTQLRTCGYNISETVKSMERIFPRIQLPSESGDKSAEAIGKTIDLMRQFEHQTNELGRLRNELESLLRHYKQM